MTLFVEIAAKPILKRAFAEQTIYFSTYHNREAHQPQSGSYSLGIKTMPLLWRTLARRDVALVCCDAAVFAPWSPRWMVRAIFDRRIFRGHCPIVRAWGPQLLRCRLNAPLAVVDQDDLPLINAHNISLLRRSTLYFKRELSIDRWRLFMKTAHANLPSIRFRGRSSIGNHIDKLRPISLGLPPDYPIDEDVSDSPKTTDIFFAGQIDHTSTHRQRALAELQQLAATGLRIDIAEHRLAPDEFRRRMSRAWMTWSPEGLGWDCFRHYEALACGSVPLINSPTIERYQPLADGRHAIYYTPEEGGLARQVQRAFADRSQLAQMARDGRQHVLQHHTQTGIANNIINQTLAAAGGGSLTASAGRAMNLAANVQAA
jgi:glycosyltransferase involved in cell wall biosynthesis